ncbi:DUF998 domain-containing protein [Profundibacterium mesophilum]|uniref:DUF998 domain-containing protein n=1 Tax=Profundibacterium mesophilum KAUST100406-0324 TaxID=1037889 RepID=A0A921TD46_9RHOB|nr:DUF998 domain-containing protein [Profundibacterium mesophilum]KAF0675732.1 hypothetical protein PMES_01818 [Profundibacterium mesophilum KAUST100406-0324]
MTRLHDHAIGGERPVLLKLCAIIAALGAASLILGTLAAQVVVPGHDWIADTISDLGAGQYEIVMDVALYGFAAGLFVAALAASHSHMGGSGWTAGLFSLAILGAIVVVVGARNEYGDGDKEGVVIHSYLVYGLGFFFTATPLLMRPGFARIMPWMGWALLILAIGWVIVAPIFLLVPTSIDGLLERVLGVIAAAMLCTMCAGFWQRGKDVARA